jgi:hypothetical protein
MNGSFFFIKVFKGKFQEKIIIYKIQNKIEYNKLKISFRVQWLKSLDEDLTRYFQNILFKNTKNLFYG